MPCTSQQGQKAPEKAPASKAYFWPLAQTGAKLHKIMVMLMWLEHVGRHPCISRVVQPRREPYVRG